MSTKKIALLCLWLSFFFGYLEWGGDQSAFIFETAYEVLFREGDKAATFSHPFVLAPFAGQLLVLVAVFQKQPKRLLVWAGIGLMGVLMLMLIVAGALSLNVRILLSTLPFVASAAWCIRLFRRNGEGEGGEMLKGLKV